jgi:enoyl-CoA hydratase/carnithine racemase
LNVYERLIVERRGAVGWLVFDRPEVGNALDAKMMTELEDAWRELDADPAVRVIVNAGEGKNFQTGLDVAALSRDKAAMTEQSRRTRDAELRFTAWHNQVWKPVIAAVQGSCAGGGLHFVADADIVIAASDATFFDTHVSLGQAMYSEGVGLTRKMAFEPIMRMALVGRAERIPVARARQLGMVSQVVDPPARLREEAQALAEKIARNSPAAMRATKRALWGALETGLSDACRAGSQQMIAMWGHPDQEEGPVAFSEKREAQWMEIT